MSQPASIITGIDTPSMNEVLIEKVRTDTDPSVEETLKGSETMGTYKDLLRDANVTLWQKRLGERSTRTATIYLKNLSRFCKENRLLPSELIRQRERERQKLLTKWRDQCATKFTPKAAGVYIYAVLSFVKFMGKKTSVPSLANTNQTPSIMDEKIPTQEQIRKLLNLCNPRAATIASLIAFAGLRFESQSKLTLGDLIDLDIPQLQFKNVPALIYIPAHANKTPVQYFSLLIQDGCEKVIAYLQWRRAKGEQLTEKSWLIANLRGGPLTPDMLSDIIRPNTKTILRSRPYVLRSYFDSQMLSARVHPNWMSFFMGHRGNIEAVYTTKKHLPPTMIEAMKEAFKPAIEFLTTYPKQDAEEQRKKDFIKTVEAITAAGLFSPQELEALILQKVRPRNS
ncbi:MAG: site-specific integrase [Thaumarchaeota archaeon]|nr:site-specific integrase [Nitrososphaerota archaeon]